MDHWFDFIRSQLHFKQFQIGEILFARYTCPIPEGKVGIWSDHDCIIHVASGKKIWHTRNESWPAVAGDTIYFKKGCFTVEQFFDEDFCFLCFVIPDDFIRIVVRELASSPVDQRIHLNLESTAIRLVNDVSLKGYLQSMASYFAAPQSPPKEILELKLRELVTGIALSSENKELAAYFRWIASSDSPPIDRVMEQHFLQNLSLDEFARLCGRSLSSFKRDFGKAFGMPPGRWLLDRRLTEAAHMLARTEASITDVAFSCGFEDLSHFSKSFKARYDLSPSDYRSANLVPGNDA